MEDLGEWTKVLDGALKILDMVVKIVVIPGAIVVFRILRKRWNLPINEEQAKDVERSIERGILYTEEQAIKAWKQSKSIIPGPEKLDLAKTKAREFSATGLASIPETELVALIEAKVNELRPRMSSFPPPPSVSIPPPPTSMLPPRA